jgi:hypothetical protein
MGSGRSSAEDWKSYTSSHATSKGFTSYSSMPVAAIYDKRGLDPDLDPKNIKFRESRDSADNPKSTPLILALDVTGSMGIIADAIAKTGLNTLMTEVYARKPISDPHILSIGIGDVEYDNSPLQATQFEADIRIMQQVEKLYLEHGGGGNHYESYILAWYFAARKCVSDSFEKRGKKGYLFTFGDEEPTPRITKEHLADVFGPGQYEDVDRDALLTEVSRQWEVFHVMIAEGDYARSAERKVRDGWTNLLGQRAVWLKDHTKLGELIVSLIQINEGADHAVVANSWDGTTALVVGDATRGLTKSSTTTGSIVTL